MDEINHFLPKTSKRSKKKREYIYNKSPITSNEDLSNKFYIISIIILIITSIILIIQIRNKKQDNNFVNQDKKIININQTNPIINKQKKFKRIFQYKEDIIENNDKNQIHISMAIDNYYNYPTLVSMTSILQNNKKEKNIIIFHLLLSHNYNVTNIDIFESLKNNYEVKINYYIIPNIFRNLRTWSDKTDTIYYKILLPLIFLDLERIIYLDSDTLTFKDLYEMYTLPFHDNYILGYPFQDVVKIDKFVKNAMVYINGGVLLFNIKKIREDNRDIELLRLTFEKNDNLWFLEQDSINVVFFQKIGLLPLKYGIYLYGDMKAFERWYEKRLRIKLNKDELNNAMNDPSLVHLSCCNPKVWNRLSRNDFGYNEICDKYRKIFYFYANKTKYYTEIYNKYMK